MVLPISGDLKLGGRYQLEGNAGGTITRCDPPTHLALTWEYGGQVSWVDVRLSPERQGTRAGLEHAAHMPDEFWAQYGPGAVGVGWDLGLRARRCTSKPARRWTVPKDGVARHAGGRQFVEESSDGWPRHPSPRVPTRPERSRPRTDHRLLYRRGRSQPADARLRCAG